MIEEIVVGEASTNSFANIFVAVIRSLKQVECIALGHFFVLGQAQITDDLLQTHQTNVVVDAVVDLVEFVNEPVGVWRRAANFHAIVHHENDVREDAVYVLVADEYVLIA